MNYQKILSYAKLAAKEDTNVIRLSPPTCIARPEYLNIDSIDEELRRYQIISKGSRHSIARDFG